MVPPGTVPAVLEYCLSEVERRGLTENGICTTCLLSSLDDLTFSLQIAKLVQ